MTKKILLHEKAEQAMKAAVKKVVSDHKKSGRPLAIWKNGKAVNVAADKL